MWSIARTKIVISSFNIKSGKQSPGLIFEKTCREVQEKIADKFFPTKIKVNNLRFHCKKVISKVLNFSNFSRNTFRQHFFGRLTIFSIMIGKRQTYKARLRNYLIPSNTPIFCSTNREKTRRFMRRLLRWYQLYQSN